MRMMFAINQENFDSKQVVTCNSCHRGAPHPVSIPMMEESGATPSFTISSEAEVTGNTPSPDAVIAKYLNAIGGSAALSQVKTRQEKGMITISRRDLPVEIITSAVGSNLLLSICPAATASPLTTVRLVGVQHQIVRRTQFRPLNLSQLDSRQTCSCQCM